MQIQQVGLLAGGARVQRRELRRRTVGRVRCRAGDRAGSTAVVDELPSAPEAPTRMTLPGQIDDEAVAELQLEREEVARGCQREAGRPALHAGGDRPGDGAHPDDEPGSFQLSGVDAVPAARHLDLVTTDRDAIEQETRLRGGGHE